MMEDFVRPLTLQELRLLKIAIQWRSRRLMLLPRRTWLYSVIICGGLLVLTLVADPRHWYVIIPFWVALGTALMLWNYFPVKRQFTADLRQYESALRRSEARVMRVESTEVVRFEEVEDEGACYAFQVSGDRLVFVSGQDFYASAKFPNSDFSLVDILAANGTAIAMLIEKNGVKLKPTRVIPASLKAKLTIPEHLDVMDGRLADIEQLLRN